MEAKSEFMTLIEESHIPSTGYKWYENTLDETKSFIKMIDVVVRKRKPKLNPKYVAKAVIDFYNYSAISILCKEFPNKKHLNVAATIMAVLSDVFKGNHVQTSLTGRTVLMLTELYLRLHERIPVRIIVPLFKECFDERRSKIYDPETNVDEYLELVKFYSFDRVNNCLTTRLQLLYMREKMWDEWKIEDEKEIEEPNSYAQWFPRETMEDVLSFLTCTMEDDHKHVYVNPFGC